MSLDYERENEKLKELESIVLSSLVDSGLESISAKDTSSLILENFVTTTAPEKPEVLIALITADSFSGRGGGKSVKKGNIRLNMGTFIEALSAGVFTAVSAAVAPWAVPFAAVLLWRSLWKSAEVPLTQNEVVVLIVLHQMKDGKVVKKSDSEILKKVNERLEKYDLSSITTGDLKFALKNLEKIESIEKMENDDWFIREWVRVAYS
ncbi:MAG: hypothetical protein COB41_02280 [Proteobacteria bacterium]|nr:MAG: hypothetical protein COB41_02280 [Pseudomonadota bacterium]